MRASFMRSRRLRTAFFLTVVVICVLGAAASSFAPPAISGLTSPTHPSATTWYTNGNPVFPWNPTAGLAGYAYVLDHAPATDPGTTLQPQPRMADYRGRVCRLCLAPELTCRFGA
jgi:hypothetical protein